MPSGIIKLTDGAESWYLIWSTVVDAPTTHGMTLDELREHIRFREGEDGIRALPERLRRVEAKGTSFVNDVDADDTIFLNRAGPREKQLTKRQIIARYCGGSAAEKKPAQLAVTRKPRTHASR